jgi:hypothetical protein
MAGMGRLAGYHECADLSAAASAGISFAASEPLASGVAGADYARIDVYDFSISNKLAIAAIETKSQNVADLLRTIL